MKRIQRAPGVTVKMPAFATVLTVLHNPMGAWKPSSFDPWIVKLLVTTTAVVQLAEIAVASATRTGFEVRVLLLALELSRTTAERV